MDRQFNFIVLDAPRGKYPANIEVTWGLASSEFSAYLDCVPEYVAEFEKTASSSPG